MPQLDPSSYPSQLFWLTVCFITLYIAVARYLVPRIQDVLETRQSRISHDLDRSAEMKREAEEIQQAYEKTLEQARLKAQSVLADTQRALEQIEAGRRAELDATIARKVAESEAAIATARQNAVNQLAPVAKELVGQVVEVLIGNKPAPDRINSAMESLAKARQV